MTRKEKCVLALVRKVPGETLSGGPMAMPSPGREGPWLSPFSQTPAWDQVPWPERWVIAAVCSGGRGKGQFLEKGLVQMRSLGEELWTAATQLYAHCLKQCGCGGVGMWTQLCLSFQPISQLLLCSQWDVIAQEMLVIVYSNELRRIKKIDTGHTLSH